MCLALLVHDQRLSTGHKECFQCQALRSRPRNSYLGKTSKVVLWYFVTPLVIFPLDSHRWITSKPAFPASKYWESRCWKNSRSNDLWTEQFSKRMREKDAFEAPSFGLPILHKQAQRSCARPPAWTQGRPIFLEAFRTRSWSLHKLLLSENIWHPKHSRPWPALLCSKQSSEHPFWPEIAGTKKDSSLEIPWCDYGHDALWKAGLNSPEVRGVFSL